MIEAEALFDGEGVPYRQRQFQQAHDEHGADDHGHAGEEWSEAHAAPEVVEQFHAAAQGPGQQEQRIHQQFEQSEAHAGHGIVGGLLMGFERNGVAKGGGDFGAVRQHVGDMASRQPDLQQGGDAEHGQEQRGERVHGSDIILSDSICAG